MRTIDIRQAKIQLSLLVDQVANGEPFIITKAGKPVAKVTSLDSPEVVQVRRIGFLAGQITVPHDFNHIGAAGIERQFGLSD
jgi:prevent-host-death family protein